MTYHRTDGDWRSLWNAQVAEVTSRSSSEYCLASWEYQMCGGEMARMKAAIGPARGAPYAAARRAVRTIVNSPHMSGGIRMEISESPKRCTQMNITTA